MSTKKALLASWDTLEIIEAQVENLKESGEWPDKTDKELFNLASDDSDLFEIEWDYFTQNVTDILAERHPSGFFRVEGRNLGWQGRAGFKYACLTTWKELRDALLPRTSDFTLKIYASGIHGLAIRCSHHDAPTGEFYLLRPVTEKTYIKNT